MSYDIYELKNILDEMRRYDPKADEYGGKHIIPGWADRIEVALGRTKGGSVFTKQVYKAIDKIDETLCYFYFDNDAGTSNVIEAKYCSDDMDAVRFLRECKLETRDNHEFPPRDDMIDPVLIAEW